MKSEGTKRISKVETTGEIISGRGGLALFVRYLRQVDVYKLLSGTFKGQKHRDRTCGVENAFKQIFCFFMDGSSRHVSYFDHLKQDEGYAATIENQAKEMLSSHAIKRFFKKFRVNHSGLFRKLLREELFAWRLKEQQPQVVILTVDTMVMNNDDAAGREGVQPTYKKVKGFQPLQLIWEGKIVDAVFRGGKKHGNHGDTALNMLKKTVKVIRSKYRSDVPIVVRMDSGFLDQKILEPLDQWGVLWICSGKMYNQLKERVARRPPSHWHSYANEHQQWSWVELLYGCKDWEWEYRTFYTRPVYEQKQQLLEFARPDNVIVTNIDEDHPAIRRMPEAQQRQWLEGQWIIHLHHQRGADELPHRGLKDFGHQTLPFKHFMPNSAFYYCMLVSFFLFETFKEDVLRSVVPMRAYATTVRRLVIDIAAKLVRSARQMVMKVSTATMNRLGLDALWTRCACAPPIRT